MSARMRRLTGLVVCFVLAVVAYAPACASGVLASTGYGSWRWQYPRPQGNSLIAVKSIGSKKAWTVGDAGTILKTSNGGKTWHRQTSGVMKALADVDFTDTKYGWAVGGDGANGRVVLKTKDGGTHWKKVGSSSLPTNLSITKVDFVDRKVGWVGCTQGRVYKTTNGGKSWHALGVPLHADVTSLRFITRRTGWVCGRGGFELGGKILKTTNGGTTWSTYSWHPELGDDGECVTAMTFASSKIGWFVTSQARVFKTSNRGKHWSVQYSSGSDWEYRDVDFATKNTGWVATNSTVIRTTNGGHTWKKPTHPVRNVMCVGHLSSTHLVALGEAGFTYRSTTRGKMWSRIGSGAEASFSSVSFGDASHGWTVSDGLILHTTNGGASWSSQPLPSGALGPMDISAASRSAGWTCGYGDIMRTVVGGATWSPVFDGAPWTYAISSAGAMRAISVGEDGSALWTDDGGSHWHTGATGTSVSLRAVDMVNSSTAFALGDDGTILITANGGQTWSARNVDSAYGLSAVDFISTTEGWVAGERSGRPAVLHTTNAGAVWHVQATGSASGGLSSVAFLDHDHGLAVGNVGGYGLTMSTTDGGATWHRGYSGTDSLFRCAYVSAGKQIAVGQNAIIARDPR